MWPAIRLVVSHLGVEIADCGHTLRVLDRKPIFLLIKVSLRVVHKGSTYTKKQMA